MCAAATSRVQKPVWSLVVDYTLFPLVALPVCCVYLVVARVLSMDLHADQIQGFFDIPVDNIYASPVC